MPPQKAKQSITACFCTMRALRRSTSTPPMMAVRLPPSKVTLALFLVTPLIMAKACTVEDSSPLSAGCGRRPRRAPPQDGAKRTRRQRPEIETVPRQHVEPVEQQRAADGHPDDAAGELARARGRDQEAGAKRHQQHRPPAEPVREVDDADVVEREDDADRREPGAEEEPRQQVAERSAGAAREARAGARAGGEGVAHDRPPRSVGSACITARTTIESPTSTSSSGHAVRHWRPKVWVTTRSSQMPTESTPRPPARSSFSSGQPMRRRARRIIRIGQELCQKRPKSCSEFTSSQTPTSATQRPARRFFGLRAATSCQAPAPITKKGQRRPKPSSSMRSSCTSVRTSPARTRATPKPSTDLSMRVSGSIECSFCSIRRHST